MQDVTSVSLLRRVSNPADVEAWEEFVQRYGKSIHCWCSKWATPATSAMVDDVSQEILLKLIAKMRTYQYNPSRGKFRSWLATVARNAWIDFMTEKTKQRDALAVFAESQPDQSFVDLIQKECERELVEILIARVRSQVTERDWDVFLALFYDERPVREVAQQHAITVSHAYVIKSNVLKVFNQQRQDVDPDFEG